MPFEIVRNDITCMKVDAIVNTANPRPAVGSGVDAAVHRRAGFRLFAARKRVGDIRVGDAAITPAYDLNASYVIHTVGPVWQGGGHNEEKLLRSCYDRSLQLAKKHHCRSVAFPLISAGNYGFPPSLALQIAMDTIQEFLAEYEMQVYLVVFDRESFQLSERLFRDISSFIDENYVQQQEYWQLELEEYTAADDRREYACQAQMPPRQEQTLFPREQMPPRRKLKKTRSKTRGDGIPFTSPKPAPAPSKAPAPAQKGFPFLGAKPSLEQLLTQTDAGFSETLLTLIDRTGKKDSEIYARANVSRQHFSKIRNNPDYKPTKATAIALAIALELDLEQTRDLIGRAGYALTNSSKFDVIIMYFIREKNYNMFDINTALFEFDQSLLGA